MSAELFPSGFGGEPAMLYKLGYKSKGLELALEGKDVGFDQKLEDVAAELKISQSDLYQLIFKFGVDSAEGKIEFKGKDLKASAGIKHEGGETTAEGAVEFKHGDWMAKAMVKGNLTKGQIETIVASLGFKSDGDFRQFSINFARKVSDEGATDTVSALFDYAIGDFIVRGEARASYLEGTGMSGAGASAYVAAPITSDIKGIAGLKVDYDFLKDKTEVMPGVGLQLGNVPLMFHTDFKDKFLFSIAVKF
jgi:hypothetical protein